MKPASAKYRPDIDGLRAAAIMPVVWFHSGLPGLPGGFTGVDTFFVISGYLITLIIHREVRAGGFSFSRFYERRIRRIAPALILVLMTSTIVAYALLLPYELVDYSWSAVGAIAMVSNILYWQNAGYFALADSATPLLHTWSLGVEEQFYLIFPTALIIAERLRAVRPFIALSALASFLLCLWMTMRSPGAAFYLLPTRGWELMAGASLAVGLIDIPAIFRAVAGMMGLVLLVAAALVLTGEDPFPGWRAIIPVLGAVLVIGAGAAGPSGRILSARPLVYIGRVSYSFYLWHWPVFVFLRHWRANPNLSPAAALAGITISFVLASASYRWLEQPARKRSTSYGQVLAFSGAGAALILASACVAILGQGFPRRLPAQVIRLAAGRNAFAPMAHRCTDIGVLRATEDCRLGPPGRAKVLLWGDSHAAALSEAVEKGIGQPGFVLSAGGCPPAIGWVSKRLKGRDPQKCRAFNESALDRIRRDQTLSTVVLGAYWPSYDKEGGRTFWASVQKTVDRIHADHKKVIIIAGIPDPGIDVPWASAIRARFNRPPLKRACPPAAVPLENAIVADVARGFCQYPTADLFTDRNHLSRFAGLAIVAPALKHIELRH